jgi:NAD(P)-dependent dehydrogenase (short-subunit alcohol dehydrogenase family)
MRSLQVLWPTTIGVYFLLLAIITSTTTTDGLNIAITGSSQGIGLEAATRLIADGHTVYHACRNQERANVAQQESGGGIPMICDLNDFHSIRHFSEQLIKKSTTPKNGGLDVLCLNAGIAPSTKSTVPKLTKDGYEECIGVNHLGHFLLANLLKDHLLKESSSSSGSGNSSGRIVITASSVHDPEGPGGAVGGKGGATLGDLSGLGINLTDNKNNSEELPTMPDGSLIYDGGKIYKDSKLCNLLFMREAVKRWGGNNGKDNDNDDHGLQILSFNPGFIPSSGLFRAPREDNWFGATAFTFIAGVIGFAVPIDIGGGRLAYMATVNTKKSTTSTDGIIKNGSYFSADVKSKGTTIEDGFDDQTTISVEASNDDIASQLWDISAKIVGV